VPGINIDPHVIVRQLVDHGIAGLFADLGDASPDLDIALPVVRIDGENGDLGAFKEILVLLAAGGGIDPNMAIDVIRPDRRDLRLTVGLHGRETDDDRTGEQILIGVRNAGQWRSPRS